MKIIKQLKLSEGQTALALNKFATKEEKIIFKKWTDEIGISEYAVIEDYYESDMFGDVDYPAIQIKKGAPKKLKFFA